MSTIELKVPEVGESISEVEIGTWFKNEGDAVQKDEKLVEIETDKVTVELPAPSSGVLGKILRQKGESASVGDVIGRLDEGAAAKPANAAKAEKAEKAEKPVPKAVAPPQAAEKAAARVMPAARRLLEENGLAADEVEASGPGGRLLKEDVLRHLEKGPATPAAKPQPAATKPTPSTVAGREEEVVPMSTLRRRVAERLLDAQRNAAILTTFNEIDMSAVQALRYQHQEAFQKRYGVKLGFMSFFVKAAVDALKLVPEVNAEVRGTDVVYRNYFDVGVAVGGGRGLVVPILRNAERMSFAEIETTIHDFAVRAHDNRLKVDELQGGTFTISNGGVYGSLLSTPILNPPQSGILGLHAIQERPIAVEGRIEIRPMMYVALSYDHRIIDGREAVTCLKRIKDAVESPARLLIEV